MKRISEVMHSRRATDAEQDVVDRVVRYALAYEMGDVTLEEVQAGCTEPERLVAMRFAENGSAGKFALMGMVDAMIAADDRKRNIAAGETDVPPLYLSDFDLGKLAYAQMTNDKGQRVWVSPMFHIDDEPYYPPVHVPIGDERREREMAANLRYNEERRKKKGPRRASE